MGLGPLPQIKETVYQEGDVVVYDGFVFKVNSPVVDGAVVISNECGDVWTVPENFISLL